MTGDRMAAVGPLVLVALLAALTFWLEQLTHEPAGGPAGANHHDPDYMVDQLSAITMSEDGAPRYTLSAAKMVHYPHDDSTVLARPRFVSYGGAPAPVTITSNAAIVSANGEHVYFHDDVQVTRSAHGAHSELVMRTAFLHVIPDDHIARTDRTVTIQDGTTTVTAVGFELNNETRVIKLHSNVRGTYDAAGVRKR